MRATPLLFAVAGLSASAARARADNFVEVAGGIMIPVEDDQWTSYVESGPKLAARVGGVGENHLGALLSVDWTPLNTDDQGFGGAVDISADRFRILANIITEQRLGPKLYGTLRVGAGIDITRTTVDTNLGPLSSHEKDTDSGLALEAAGGLWVKAGNLQLGGELALPLSFNSDGNNENVDLKDYSSFDIDILFGVRFISK